MIFNRTARPLIKSRVRLGYIASRNVHNTRRTSIGLQPQRWDARVDRYIVAFKIDYAFARSPFLTEIKHTSFSTIGPTLYAPPTFRRQKLHLREIPIGER